MQGVGTCDFCPIRLTSTGHGTQPGPIRAARAASAARRANARAGDLRRIATAAGLVVPRPRSRRQCGRGPIPGVTVDAVQRRRFERRRDHNRQVRGSSRGCETCPSPARAIARTVPHPHDRGAARRPRCPGRRAIGPGSCACSMFHLSPAGWTTRSGTPSIRRPSRSARSASWKPSRRRWRASRARSRRGWNAAASPSSPVITVSRTRAYPPIHRR